MILELIVTFIPIELYHHVFKFFNKRVVYDCEMGVYDFRYDSIDLQSMRPIHKNMSVAPYWATPKLIDYNDKTQYRGRKNTRQNSRKF